MNIALQTKKNPHLFKSLLRADIIHGVQPKVTMATEVRFHSIFRRPPKRNLLRDLPDV